MQKQAEGILSGGDIVRIPMWVSFWRKNVHKYWLTHLSLASYKRDIGKQWISRSDAAYAIGRGVWSGSKLFALRTGISVNHGNNKNKTDTSFTEKGLVQSIHSVSKTVIAYERACDTRGRMLKIDCKMLHNVL